jgi:phosphatidylserine/phosphatidylglycerophosphate/cardiolipin synthase-like enzyme
METMLPSFKNLIKRGIKIKCVIPPPDNNGSLDEVSGRQILSLLEKTGVAIEYRQKIHQKAVLIDDNVVWFGSLNPLSFSGSTHETMLRLDKPKLSYVFAENFSTHSQYKNIDTIDKLVEVHNPSCSKCGQHTVAKSSKYGKYFQCINCGEKANFR